MKSYIQKIARQNENQIAEYLKKYEKEKGKTVYQHLMDVMDDKEAVDKLFEPLNQNTNS
ncbi:MAG: hypothetical protein PF436_07730 [Prolixibacteraceae bacterium]|nr:hypothetical protein [Prolixibacteraceae bacterium]